MITLQNLSKNFGAQPVLIDISLEISKGEVVTLMGASGSGKSMLLRCIHLLETPSQGSVTVADVTWDSRNPDADKIIKLRRHIGMVFQNFHLFPHLTALENITYAPLKVLGESKVAAREKAMELLKRMKLEGFADCFPRSLSGGQKQRVAIARALAMEPEVMLFDEPTSALDPGMIKEVQEVVQQLSSQSMTMIIVTHAIHFAKTVASRVLFMDQGRILEDARPETFFSAPTTGRAQEFLQIL